MTMILRNSSDQHDDYAVRAAAAAASGDRHEQDHMSEQPSQTPTVANSATSYHEAAIRQSQPSRR